MDDERALRDLSAAEDGALPATDDTVRRLRQTLALLTEFSPGRRGACPSREELVCYFDRTLMADISARVEAHVAACPFCAAELADLDALATPPLFEAVVRLAREGLTLVSHSFGSAALPRPALVRGLPEAPVVELEAKGEDLDLLLRVQSGSAGRADVRLQLRAGRERARVSLQRQDSLLESRLAEGAEEVVFADVPGGDYTIVVTPLDGDEVARVALSLEAEEGARP